MNTRPPSNAAAIQSLKDQGFDVKINHYRQVLNVRNIHELRVRYEIVPDYDWRLDPHNLWLMDNGGATTLKLTRGTEQYEIRANCYHKDRFCRRIGVKYCLDKLAEQYDIKP